MSPKPQTESQTTIAQSGGATIPVSTGFPLPGEHSNLLPVGTRLGEFELTGLVGEGGFGPAPLCSAGLFSTHID